MSEKETLTKMLRRWADDKNATICEICCYMTGTSYSSDCDCDCDCNAWKRKLADITEREYLPMPRYEDGEPVEVGSVCEWGVVESVEVTASDGGWGNWLVRCGEDGEPHEGTLDQRVERGALVEGKPVKVGDELWAGGDRVTVRKVLDCTHIVTDYTVTDAEGDEVAYPFELDELTWERPDNMERIREDALNNFVDYWGCEDTPCQRCPAKVGGKTPAERYGVGSCQTAVRFDLISRTEEVCGR